ncbi:MAG: ArsA family ATPase [Acidimicrobiia bacterium]
MAGRRAAPVEPGLEELLAAKEMIIVCGTGGVGKTTTAAALGALAAARLGGRVLVLTVDPARRLASAMGIEALSHEVVQVPLDVFSDAGVRPRGELWAAMLDTKSSWDDLIRRHAPDAKVRETVLANPLYQNITGRFVHSHDYIAMEKLHELHASGRYDLVIIDTPPSRNALDFLDAPARMADFFGSRLLRWLTVPYRSRFFAAASKPFYQVADRVLGSRFLQDIAEFFLLFQSMEAGFVTRAREVESLLTDPRTSFCVVTTLEASPLVETRFFADALHERSLHLGAVIVNKVLPAGLREPRAAKAAGKLRREASARAAELEPVVGRDRIAIEGVLVEVANRFDDVAVVAKREAERLTELAGLAPTMAIVPALDSDIHDLEGLLRLGSYLWRRT